MEKLTVILDPAHGVDTPGKCSPDKTHREYLWSRAICRQMEYLLAAKGFPVYWSNETDKETDMLRVKTANAVPAKRKLLVSMHNNAAGNNGQWMNASGVEIWTTRGVTKSDKCAEIIIKQLRNDFPELKFRTDLSDGDQDKEAGFFVLKGSTYMACLLEWLFQDSKIDVALLKNTAFNDRLVKSMVIAIETIDKEVL